MANRSTFPTTVDTFVEHYDISPSDLPNVTRYQELKLKIGRTTAENTELNNLTTTLRSKIFTPEDLNKLQDCLTNLEVFFRDNVQNEIINTRNSAIATIESKMNEVVTYLDSTEAGSLRNDIGSLPSLRTANKNNLVSAVNECKVSITASAPSPTFTDMLWIDTSV